MIFTGAVLGVFMSFFILGVESLIYWSPWRFLTYTGEQYGWMVLGATISNMSVVCNIIAAQNEKAAIIQMIGYISLIYAFLGDFFIFHLTISGLQLIGVIIVLGFSASMIIYNCTQGPKKTKEIIKNLEAELLLPAE
jgi:drug/metabolite transporter (DMT)-like permease